MYGYRREDEDLLSQGARFWIGIRPTSAMKSEDAFKSDAKKSSQSLGRGVKIMLPPSRRMKTSRTDWGNLKAVGMVTV